MSGSIKINNTQKESNSFALCALMLFLSVFVVYFPALFYDFVWDDHSFIILNPYIKSFDHLSQFFSTGFPLNRLMSLGSFALNYKIYGFNPFGYHAFNLIIHAAATFAIWWLARLFFVQVPIHQGELITFESKERFSWVAFFVALLFCLHPVQVQAVAYITQRFASQATLFYVLSLCFYIQGRLIGGLKKSLLSFLLAMLAGLLAITSKEEAVSLPFMIIAVEFFFFSKTKDFFLRFGSLKIVIGLAIFFGVFVKLFNSNVLAILRSTIVSESHEGDILNLGTYLLTQIKVFVTFLWLLIYPFPQNLDYDYPMVHSILEPGVLLRLLLIFLMIFSALKFRKKLPLASFGICWFFIAFSANLVPRANVIWEHKLYLISFGFVLLLVVLLNHLIRSFRFFCLVMIIIALFWGGATFVRHHVFKDNLSLWTDNVAHSPNKWRPVCNLAYEYLIRGDMDKAEGLYKRGAFLSPLNPLPVVNLAAFYFEKGMYERSAQFYEQAIKLGSNSIEARHYLGACYEMMGNYKRAIRVYNIAYIFGSNDSSLVHRGMVYLKLKDFKKAEHDFKVALQDNLSDVDALSGMSQLYEVRGDAQKALGFLDRAVILNPNNENAYLQRGLFLYKKDKARSKSDIFKAYDLNPYNMKVSTTFNSLKF